MGPGLNYRVPSLLEAQPSPVEDNHLIEGYEDDEGTGASLL